MNQVDRLLAAAVGLLVAPHRPPPAHRPEPASRGQFARADE